VQSGRAPNASQSQDFLRQVIDINSGLIFAKDIQGRFTLANRAVADLYGASTHDLIGKTDADFDLVREQAAASHRANLQVIDTRQELFASEEQITDAKGKVHWLQTLRCPVLDPDGTVTQVLTSATDITAWKEKELQIERQRNELAHLSRVTMLSELAGSLAHELNQPLTAILSNAQAALRFLAQNRPDLEEINDILRDIVRDDKRAGEVIEGMRALLKKTETRYEPVDINEVIQTVVKLVRSDLLNAGVSLNMALASDLPLVKGDRVQLQQVLINLFMNGSGAMRDNPSADRKLFVSSELDGNDDILVCVADQGHGIPPNDLKRVFEPFFSTKSNGMGLGLSVCFKIMSAHGGALWAANNANRGASFRFVLPAEPDGNHTGP
jgi:two-component system, LuxR family, sensor kinase FixL